MVEPLLEAHTEWVEPEDGEKRLKWTCPECEVDVFTERRYATKCCPECEKIMEAVNYDCSGNAPDPENPKKFLRDVAKRRGFQYDHYYPDESAEPEDPLSW